jgi:two-component system response regulator MprA
VSSQRKTKVVLCIDDCNAVLQCLDFYLRTRGYAVLTASSGSEGLALVASEKVDAVILDCRMPGMSGCQVALRMRELGLQLPIIIFSAEERVPAPMANIVDACIPKGCAGSLLLLGRSVDRLTSEPGRSRTVGRHYATKSLAITLNSAVGRSLHRKESHLRSVRLQR